MKSTFEIESSKIRKIMSKIFFKSNMSTLLIVLGAVTIYVYVIKLLGGISGDPRALKESYTYLICLVLELVLFIFCYSQSVLRYCIGKKNKTFTYEYEFNPAFVVVKRKETNNSYVLNKNKIKKYYIIQDTLVVIADRLFCFPNNEEIKKELYINRIR